MEDHNLVHAIVALVLQTAAITSMLRCLFLCILCVLTLVEQYPTVYIGWKYNNAY